MIELKEQQRDMDKVGILDLSDLENKKPKKYSAVKSMHCIGERRDGILDNYYEEEDLEDEDMFESEEQVELFVSAKEIDLHCNEKQNKIVDKKIPFARSSSVSFDIIPPVPLLDLSSSETSSCSPSPRKAGQNSIFSPESKRKSSSHSSLKISIPSRKPKVSPSMQSRRLFEEKYTCLEKLGQGALGEVRHCRVKGSQQDFAVKIIPFKDGEQLLDISKEFFLLESLRHPNLIRAYDFFIENKKCLIIIDYVQGFSLTQFLKNHTRMKEEQAKFVISEIIKAAQYLHYKGVCHRDITTNNVLVDDSKHSIKLIDLSNSKSYDFAQRMMTKTGTLSYMAPEIFSEQEYDKQIDLWSIGVVMFQLLSGMLPFFNECETTLIADIQSKELDFSPQNPLLSHCSTQALDFLSRLLQKNPANRLTVAEAICHPWLLSTNLMCSFTKKIKHTKSSLNIAYGKPSNTRPPVECLSVLLLQEEAPRDRAETAQESVNVTRYAQRCISSAGWSTKQSQILKNTTNANHEIDQSSSQQYPEKTSPSTECTVLFSIEKDSEEEQNQEKYSEFGILRNLSPCKKPLENCHEDAKEDTHKKRIRSKQFIEQEGIFEEEREGEEYHDQKQQQQQSLRDSSCSKAWQFANNDTNFNDKVQIAPETLELELEVRKRSRSSIYYSPLI